MTNRKNKSVKFDSQLSYISPAPQPEMIFVPNREEFEEFSKQETSQNLQGLAGIQISYQNFRSPNSITVLAVGLSGDGITFTLDHLMGRQGIAEVGKRTQAILEHTFNWPSTSMGISNSKIIFIDTPGLGHPESSSEMDLQSLKNIVKYFELKQYHPNFVLLIGNLAQPGIERKKGRFIKFVKMVKQTLENTVLDLINSNVMLVLTHLAECVPSVQKDPSEVVKSLGEAVASALKIENKPPVVVVAENEVGEYNLKRTDNGFFLLPNNELYPKNIYEGMMALADKHDPLGYNLASEICKDFEFLQAMEAKSKLFSFPGLSLVPYSYFYESTPDRPEWPTYAKTRPLSLSQIQIHKSYAAGRATNSTTILFIGAAGVGKSSTINSMFGRKVAPVSDNEEDGTQDIVEYSVQVPSKNLLQANSKINIIDTPGLIHPARSLDYDAKVYANIRRYFETKDVRPNAILLTANITEQLTSPSNPFVKLLRAIRAELRDVVLDTVRPNLLVVLTHLCALPNLLQHDPTDLVMSVKKLVMTTLNISDVPVEVAENLFQDLHLHSSNHYLPTKQWFPRNLFVRIAICCLAGADPVGQQIMNDGFRELPNKEIQTTVFPLEELPGPSNKVTQVPIVDSSVAANEVEESLKATWASLSLEEKIECRLQLDEICNVITKHGFKSKTQLVNSRRDLMKLYQALNPDPGMERFLNKALGIEIARFEADPMVGKGYDLLRDSLKDFPVFLLGEPIVQQGIYLPKYAVASLCPERKLIWLHSHSKHYLVRRRLSQLNIEFNQRVSRPNYNFRPGFNLIHDYETLTAVYDFHWMKLDLDEKAPINPDFENLVKDLPNSYTKCQRAQWQDFMHKVGVHYVSTSYIGASIIFEIKNLNPDAVRRLDNHSYNADSFLNYLLALPRVLPTNREDSNLSLTFIGGDPTKGEELQESRNNFEFFARLKRWEFAIWENPIVSDMAVGLSEVVDLVTKMDPRTGKALRTAIKDLRHLQDGVDCNRCAIE